jgi:PBSX family phage terminase large subunit
MLLTPAQSRIAKSRKRFRVVCAGRRFGKSTLASMEMFAKALSKNDRRICYIAPTFQQARDIVWNELIKTCKAVATKINETRLEITIRTIDGGSSLLSLRGWESVETLRGQKFDFVVIDEVAMMRNFWENWQEVLRPTLTDRKGDVLFISTPKGFNHFYDLFNTVDEDYESFHFTSYDNPHLPSEEIDKARKELPEDRFFQEYMADFRKQEGLVYKEFNRESHLYDDAEIDAVEYIAGVDFGFTNPCAVIHVMYDADGHYWISDEWYKRERTEEQIGEYVKSCKFNVVYPDPESPSAIEVLNQKGVNVHEVIKGKDSIKSGISEVRSLFKQNRIHINRRCTNLIQELETYAYPEKQNDRNENENPIKENDHAMDAMRYVLSNHDHVSMSPVEKWRMQQMAVNNRSNFSR